MTDAELDNYIQDLKKNFKGDLTHLAAALGALDLGRTYGWRVLRIIYSPIAYRKYQKILGFQFKDVLDDETQYSKRSCGFKLVESASDFWKFADRIKPIDAKVRSIAA